MKFLYLSLFTFVLVGQVNAQREFSFLNQTELDNVRPKSVELIRINGDSAEISQQLISFRKKYKWVKHIIIECPEITTVPVEVYRFNKLFKIEFINCPKIRFKNVVNSIKAHEEDIYSIGFQDMDMKGQDFSHQDALRYLESLSFVNVKNIDFSALFDALSHNKTPKYTNLGYLHIESCGMDTLYANIAELSNLRSLSVPKNKLKYLPENLPGKLKNLDISFNKLAKLPVKTFDQLGKLEFLSLDCNKLGKPEIMKLCNLNRFHEGRNFNRLKSLKFSCNESINFDTLRMISATLEPIAYYRTAAAVYINDYYPSQPDCTACNKFQFKDIINALYGEWKLVKGENEDGGVFQGRFDMIFDNQFVEIKTNDESIAGRYHYEISKFVEEEFFRISLVGYSRELLIKIEEEQLKAFIPMSGELVFFIFEK